MQSDSPRERNQKKRKTKGLTWAEAAKTVSLLSIYNYIIFFCGTFITNKNRIS